MQFCTDPCFPVCICARFDTTEYGEALTSIHTCAKSKGDNICWGVGWGLEWFLKRLGGLFMSEVLSGLRVADVAHFSIPFVLI